MSDHLNSFLYLWEKKSIRHSSLLSIKLQNKHDWLNSSPPSAAYMHRWTGSALVQIMACRLDGAKPLSEPMLSNCQGTYFNEILLEIKIFSFMKVCLNMSSAKWLPFCPGGDELTSSYLSDATDHTSWSSLGMVGISLGMHPANERHRCNVTTSLIGWAHTYCRMIPDSKLHQATAWIKEFKRLNAEKET